MAIFRKDRIVELCVGKTVLHLGFIQHSHLYADLIRRGDWLHGRISTVAKQLVGVDYLCDDVETIRDQYGYECYWGDVTQLDQLSLEMQFDVIVCGELIEHVDNPGQMLDGIKRFMGPESVLVITTPNPWNAYRMSLVKQGSHEREWLNDEHVAWYSFQTLKQLLERKAYAEVDYGYYHGENASDLRQDVKGPLGRLRQWKRMLKTHSIPEHQHDGMFFVARKCN